MKSKSKTHVHLLIFNCIAMTVMFLMIESVSDAQCLPVVDQQQNTWTLLNFAGIGQGEDYSTQEVQSFQPAFDNVTGVELLLNQGPGLTFKIGLFDVLPNTGATPLAEGTITTQTSGTPQYVSVDWAKVTVIPGQTYYIGYSWVSGSQNSVAGASNDPYPNGQLYGLGGDIVFNNYDLTFRTFSDPCNASVKISDLIALVASINLHNGISTSLDAKLDSALAALDDMNDSNDVAAINSMTAFINACEAQRGNKISDAEADLLIEGAQAVIDELTL